EIAGAFVNHWSMADQWWIMLLQSLNKYYEFPGNLECQAAPPIPLSRSNSLEVRFEGESQDQLGITASFNIVWAILNDSESRHVLEAVVVSYLLFCCILLL